jgi:hypothetical protein
MLGLLKKKERFMEILKKFAPFGVIMVLVVVIILLVLDLTGWSKLGNVKPVDSQEDTSPLTITVDEDGKVSGRMTFDSQVDLDQLRQSLFGDVLDRLSEQQAPVQEEPDDEPEITEPEPEVEEVDPLPEDPQQSNTDGWKLRESQPSVQPRDVPQPQQPRLRQPPIQPRPSQASPSQVVIYDHYYRAYVPVRR